MATEQTLRRGSSGDGVRRLQRMLASTGFEVAADGDFGPRTEEAVRAFQAAGGLVADGVVGPLTWEALLGQAAPREEPPPQREALRTLSDAGANFIARFEGFRPDLYDDPARHCTIGFGHLVHRGPCNGTEPAEFRGGITRARGLELLKSDAQKAANEVLQSVRVPLNQHQLDALISFVFNVGTGAFRRSTLLRELNEGHYQQVPTQLDKWVKAGDRTLQGLVNRRKAEGLLFAEGTY